MKKIIKIIRFIIAMTLIIAGIFLYYPLVIPIAILIILSGIKPKKKNPPPEEKDDDDDLNIFDMLNK